VVAGGEVELFVLSAVVAVVICVPVVALVVVVLVFGLIIVELSISVTTPVSSVMVFELTDVAVRVVSGVLEPM
jgi:hypothetical protein